MSLRTIKNILSLASANSLAAAVVFLVSVLVARHFGREEFGQYSFAFAFVSTFAIFSHLGLDILITRDVARDRSMAGRALGAGLVLGVALASLALAVIALAVVPMPVSSATKGMVLIVGAALLPGSVTLLCRAVFRAFQRMEVEPLVALIQGGALLAAVLVFIVAGVGVVSVVLAYPLASLVAAVASLRLVRTSFARPVLGWRPRYFRYLLITTIPFTLNGLLLPVYLRVDTIMVGVLAGEGQVGLYGAAYTVVAPLWLLGPSVARAVFPALASASVAGGATYRLLLVRTLQGSLVVLGPFLLVVAVLARQLLGLLFGSSYQEASGALPLLALAGALAFFNTLLFSALEASNRQVRTTVLLAVGAGSNLLLSLALIPVLGYLGGAIAAVAAQGMVLAMAFQFSGVMSTTGPLVQFRVLEPRARRSDG